MQAENRSAQVNLRLPPSLKDAAEKAAAADHRSLTSLIEKLLSQHIETQPTLDDWHECALARFAGLIGDRKLGEQAKLGNLARSYRVQTKDGDQLSPHELVREVNAANRALNPLVSEHHVFYPYNRTELKPYYTSDTLLFRGKETEILECVAMPPEVEGLEMWRVAPRGLATHIATHAEDDQRWESRRGTFFSPLFLTRALHDVVLHASVFGRRFASAVVVEFRCEWTGLRNRQLAGPKGVIRGDPSKLSRTDGRITRGEWPVPELGRSWPEVVSTLGGPVIRMFDPTFDYSPDWIRSLIDQL